MYDYERAIKRALLACLCAILAHSALAADGKALYTSCQGCHGTKGEGNPKLGAPNIGGMDAWYLERQLENFSSGRRGTAPDDSYGAQMRAIAATLSAAGDRKAVAAYVAKLPKVGAGQMAITGAKFDLANGRNQFNALCGACHQANGQGNAPLGAPRLAGVEAGYLARQYANFRTGLRGTHVDDKPGKQMAAVSKMLPDLQAERDVLAYIGTLRP